MSVNISHAGTKPGEPLVTLTMNMRRAKALAGMAHAGVSGHASRGQCDCSDCEDYRALLCMGQQAMATLRSMGAPE